MTYPREGHQRILIGSPAPEVRVTVRDQDGQPIAGGATVTVTVTRADGAAVAGPVTAADDTGKLGHGTGRFKAVLPNAAAATLDVLEAVWTVDGVERTTTYHRVVGGFLFDLGELRAQQGLTNPATYPDHLLAQARDVTTDTFELHTGTSWVPQYDLEQPRAHGAGLVVTTMRPVRAVRSLSIDGTDETVDSLVVDQRAGVIRSTSWCTADLLVGYEYGYTSPPRDVWRAGLIAARYLLIGDTGTAGPRTRSISGEFGTMAFSYAGEGHPTGLDEVDAVLVARDHRLMNLGG